MSIPRELTILVSKMINLGNYNSIKVEAALLVEIDVAAGETVRSVFEETNNRLKQILADTYREQIAAEPRGTAAMTGGRR